MRFIPEVMTMNQLMFQHLISQMFYVLTEVSEDPELANLNARTTPSHFQDTNHIVGSQMTHLKKLGTDLKIFLLIFMSTILFICAFLKITQNPVNSVFIIQYF